MTQAGSRPGLHLAGQRPDQLEVCGIPEPDQLGCPAPGFDSPGGEQIYDPLGHGAPSGFLRPLRGIERRDRKWDLEHGQITERKSRQK